MLAVNMNRSVNNERAVMTHEHSTLVGLSMEENGEYHEKIIVLSSHWPI